ncbi:MAG TPA: hypothetical protein VLZ81_00385 [Blastocatellia bacterium]|nr:hypothetical protein [Blastocatellia bacterium]
MNARAYLRILPMCLLGLAAFPVGSRGHKLAGAPKATDGKRVYTGTATGIGGELGHASYKFTLEITGETTSQDIQQYSQVLATKGPDEMLKTMGPNKLGTFTLEGFPGHELNFVQTRPEEKGRSITMLCERWIHTFDLPGAVKSKEYPFTYIELFINDNGKGDGSLVTAAKIEFKNNIADVTEFGSFPARLNDVQLQK